MAIKSWVKENLLFIGAFFAILIFKYLTLHPSLTTQAEMWAEGATNYYFHAKNTSFFESLFTLDYGYWPFLQRLVANALVGLSKNQHEATTLFQVFTIFFISFCCAYPCIKSNQKVISHAFLRFLISFLLAFNSNYELHTFINFSYWGFIVVLFFSARYFLDEKAQLNKWLFSFVVLVLLSKVISAAFIPCFLILAWQKKERWPFLISFFSCVTQLLIVLINKTVSPYEQSLPFFILIKSELTYMFSSFYSLFSNSTLLKSDGLSLFIFSLILLEYLHFIKIRWSRQRPFFWLHVAFLTVHALSVAIILKGYTTLYVLEFNGGILEDVWFSWRVWLLPSALLLILFFQFLELHFREFKGKKRIAFLIFSGLLVTLSVRAQTGRTKEIMAFPQINHSLFNFGENACVPINPYPWLYGGLCQYIDQPMNPPLFEDGGKAQQIPESCFSLAPPDQSKWQLKSIHLLFIEIKARPNEAVSLFVNENVIEKKASTPNLIAWDLPKEQMISNVKVCGIESISFLNKKPYYLFLGTPK